MKVKGYVYAGTLALALAAALGLSTTITQADPKKAPKIPAFVADGSWPKMPLPSAGDWGEIARLLKPFRDDALARIQRIREGRQG